MILIGLMLFDSSVSVAGNATMERSDAMQNSVRKEGNRVWIEGVPELSWDTGKVVTFVGSLEAALAVTHCPQTYTNLMGWSGLAFRTRRFEGDNGQLGSTSDVVGEFPEEFEAIEKTTGWRIENIAKVPNYRTKLNVEKLAPRIVKTIDAGIPALAYPPFWDMAAIYGYENNGERFLLRDYNMGGAYLLKASDLAPLVLVLEQKGKPLPQKEAFLQGLRIAVRNWKREPLYYPYNIGHYYYGVDGFQKWREHTGMQADGADLKGGIGFLHPITLWMLKSARESASAFLRENLELVSRDSRLALKQAASIYGQESDLMESRDWTKVTPSQFIEYIERAEQLESKAIKFIEEVLETEVTAPHDS